MYCGCLAGTHGCEQVSRVRLDQRANPVVVWLGLVSRVVRSSWRRGAFVHQCLYSHTPLRHGRGRELADSGINTGTHPPRSHRATHFNTAILLGSLSRCHSRSHGLCCSTPSASVARHHHHWHVDNLVARTGLAESLARSDFGPVIVLATESHEYQVDSSCFDHSPDVPKSHQGWASQRYLISSTFSSFNSLIASTPLF